MSNVVRWWEFAVNRKESGVLYATGYDCRTLDFIWDKHGTNLVTMLSLLQRPVEESALHIAAYFFLGLKYIHHYPHWNKTTCRRYTFYVIDRQNHGPEVLQPHCPHPHELG